MNRWLVVIVAVGLVGCTDPLVGTWESTQDVAGCGEFEFEIEDNDLEGEGEVKG